MSSLCCSFSVISSCDAAGFPFHSLGRDLFTILTTSHPTVLFCSWCNSFIQSVWMVSWLSGWLSSRLIVFYSTTVVFALMKCSLKGHLTLLVRLENRRRKGVEIDCVRRLSGESPRRKKPTTSCTLFHLNTDCNHSIGIASHKSNLFKNISKTEWDVFILLFNY